MPYYRDALPYYYGGPFSNHSSLMTGTARTIHSPLGSSRYAPLLSTISESPLSALRRYSPAATMSSRPKRVIDTADIDVSTPRALSRSDNNQHRNRLRRDRPTIRIRSQALKDNPALREHYERHEKTVGELLVEKFLIKDKKTDGDQEINLKIQSQANLESAKDKIQRDEQLEAIQRRVTRRMTRRRSSADVLMDPQQLEREVLIAQAQADALDTLVAQEQAEIEVETRMGTLIRKNLVRQTGSVLGKHESQISEEDDEVRTKKLAKKVKKRKKTTDKPSPPKESEMEREGEGQTQKTLGDKVDEAKDEDSSSNKGIKFKIEASNSVGDFSTLWINAGAAEEQKIQRQKSQDIVDQFRDSVRLPAPRAGPKIPAVGKEEKEIEEHHQVIVLPVKKRYIKDDSRNSVYLTLKTQKSGDSSKANGNLGSRVGNVEQPTRPRPNYLTDSSLTTIATIGSQSTGHIVAKFRSKDKTESDAEVESISELSGGVAEIGERRSKDKGHDQSSIISGGINETEKKRISRSVNSDESFANNKSRSDTEKVLPVISQPDTQVESDNNTDFPKSCESLRKKEGFSKEVVKVDVINDRGKDKIVKKSQDGGKSVIGGIEKKSVTKIGESAKIIKRNQSGNDTSGLDAEVQLEKNKSDRPKKSVKSDDLSVLSPISVNGNLRNSPTVDLVHVDHRNLEQLVELNVTGSNISSQENQKIFAEDTKVEFLPKVTNILGNVDQVEKLIDVEVTETANDVDASENLRKVVRKPKIDEEVITKSPKTFTPKTKNFFDFEDLKAAEKNVSDATKIQGNHNYLEKVSKIDSKENDEVRTESKDLKVVKKSPKKIVPTVKKRVITTPKEEKNLQSSVEKEELSVEAKEKSVNEKGAEKITKSPQSPVKKEDQPNNLKKIIPPLKKRVISTAKDEKGPQSPGEKIDFSIDVKEKSLSEKESEKISKEQPEVEEKVKDYPKTDEKSSKLTNGLSKIKSNSIDKNQENRELKTRIEKPKLKIWHQSFTPPIPEDDGIDFWGEIESQRLEKPATKSKIAIEEIRENDKISIVEKTTIDLKSESGENLATENSTANEPKAEEKTVTRKENKENKIKKKKNTESGGVTKKKDKEKASADTILKRVTGEGGGDESVGSLQQPNEFLSGDDQLEKEKSEKISCESSEINRFERNLSTIAEENSPVSPEPPKVQNLASVIFNNHEETSEKNLEKLEKSSNYLASDKSSITATKKPEIIVLLKPEESNILTLEAVAEVEDAEEKKSWKKSKISLVPATISLKLSSSSSATESSLPTIKIVEVPETPTEVDDELADNELDEVIREEDHEEGPKTPTNESSDETPKSIFKWNTQDDLSLEKAEDTVKPEVAVSTKKESSKKKTSTSKKTSSKKSSKNSGGSNSTNSATSSPDSSKTTKKIGRRKKSSGKSANGSEKKSIFEERESKISNSSDTTLKPGCINLKNSPKNSPRNTPKQRPLDLIKMFYTTPASLLTATPRDLSKVRRAKIKKKKHSTRTASASSDSTGSTRSTQSTGTTESNGSIEHEEGVEEKRISSTRSNDSGFDGSPRLSNCDMACHKKCEKLTGNLCGLNQKLVAEALQALKRAPSQSSDNHRNSDGSDHHHHASGRITPPATNLPRFKKYTVLDFNFLKVLGKGSFGKVLLAELRRTDCVYAVKCLKKDVVLEDDDVECTLIERKVLTLATRHPYLCHLFCTFQTDSHLFFVMEYLNGGDLMFHIQKSGRFAESRARFYAAEIWSGLNFLHKKGIVYRDLKLDNVLLDFEGHIRIADFGMCKLQIFLDRTADTFCGTPDYMAPEIIKGLKYNQAVDWWSFGVLLYEMLTGQSPFSGCDEDELFWSICNERPFIPRYLSQEAMDALVCLLEKDAGKRPLAHDIAVHPFFHSMQWDRLERRQLEPPFKPALEHTLDTRYFDTAFTAERPRLTPVPEQILTSMDQGVFRGFSYTNPNATD